MKNPILKSVEKCFINVEKCFIKNKNKKVLKSVETFWRNGKGHVIILGEMECELMNDNNNKMNGFYNERKKFEYEWKNFCNSRRNISEVGYVNVFFIRILL